MSPLHPIARLRRAAARNVPLDLNNMPPHYRHAIRRSDAHHQIKAVDLITARKDHR